MTALKNSSVDDKNGSRDKNCLVKKQIDKHWGQ